MTAKTEAQQQREAESKRAAIITAIRAAEYATYRGAAR